MKSFVSILEIPVLEVSRAIDFYQSILGIEIEKLEFPEFNMKMGLFPTEEQMVVVTLLQEEGLTPSSNGVTNYLDGGDDLQLILDKIEKSGGTIVVPKTPHADEIGYFALFIDTEGNKLGLHSPN
ncbi:MULTISPECIES: VOC family protein [unclassified Enterococcus]|uniref:VOC family protein n=1 Tax=unclassified Enterococcus TaxID=2608891 RepID=UPI001CE2122A|nr:MULTISPECIES: VOC family protein [unclassified Enterococcus]MCA5013049.1 VOC family protein [Enterococcus sp. S23]MCA5016299.1 VOC family protein [Enterococcus sp. S22(2020)]